MGAGSGLFASLCELMEFTVTEDHLTLQPTSNETRDDLASILGGNDPGSCLVNGGGGCEIRTREALPPTRFPSVRPRPLGESSAGKLIDLPGRLKPATSQWSGN